MRRCKSYQVHVNTQKSSASSQGAYMSTNTTKNSRNRDEESSIAKGGAGVKAAIRSAVASELVISLRSYKYPKQR